MPAYYEWLNLQQGLIRDSYLISWGIGGGSGLEKFSSALHKKCIPCDISYLCLYTEIKFLSMEMHGNKKNLVSGIISLSIPKDQMAAT